MRVRARARERQETRDKKRAGSGELSEERGESKVGATPIQTHTRLIHIHTYNHPYLRKVWVKIQQSSVRITARYSSS